MEPERSTAARIHDDALQFAAAQLTRDSALQTTK